jgi:hypothetical protein
VCWQRRAAVQALPRVLAARSWPRAGCGGHDRGAFVLAWSCFDGARCAGTTGLLLLSIFPRAKGGRWPKASLRMPQGACLLRVTISVCRACWVPLRRWLACSSSSTSYLLQLCSLTACHCLSPSCRGVISYPGENPARHCRCGPR